MSIDTLRIAEELESAGIPHEQAIVHAGIWRDVIDGEVPTKAFVSDLFAAQDHIINGIFEGQKIRMEAANLELLAAITSAITEAMTVAVGETSANINNKFDKIADRIDNKFDNIVDRIDKTMRLQYTVIFGITAGAFGLILTIHDII